MIEVSETDDFANVTLSSGILEGEGQIGVEAPGGALTSRETRFYRVRIRTQVGWTDWSPTLRVEAGLLEAADWQALAVTLPDDPGALRQAPAPIVRREFDLPDGIVKARLYVTSLGLHEVLINGRAVSDALLSPGWTTYHHRLLAETHDVTALLVPGLNAIAATLGDGWYRGRLGWDPGDDRCHYGDQVGRLPNSRSTWPTAADIRW